MNPIDPSAEWIEADGLGGSRVERSREPAAADLAKKLGCNVAVRRTATLVRTPDTGAALYPTVF